VNGEVFVSRTDVSQPKDVSGLMSTTERMSYSFEQPLVGLFVKW
jgi:hypothetical protein